MPYTYAVRSQLAQSIDGPQVVIELAGVANSPIRSIPVADATEQAIDDAGKSLALNYDDMMKAKVAAEGKTRVDALAAQSLIAQKFSKPVSVSDADLTAHRAKLVAAIPKPPEASHTAPVK